VAPPWPDPDDAGEFLGDGSKALACDADLEGARALLGRPFDQALACDADLEGARALLGRPFDRG
jgi:hypothetical protein